MRWKSGVKLKSILFILVGGSLPDYAENCCYSKIRPSGLANSARLVVEMLKESGVRAKMVHVIDNNSIDREVHDFKPDIVVIEALWCVPKKFKILKKLHPKVEWVVRIHSKIPFLAHEGIALDWIKDYQKEGIKIAVNCKQMIKNVFYATGVTPLYLPNYYLPEKFQNRNKALQSILIDGKFKDLIDIGCFGAIRPFKNHLIQAIAAIRYADENGLALRFHVNSTRQENAGANSVLKNLRGLFNKHPIHQLIEHGWLSHRDFLELLHEMDLGLQVSISETQNIVSADFVSLSIPVVVSDEIFWVSSLCRANPHDVDNIVSTISQVMFWSKFCKLPERRNIKRLIKFSKKSQKDWLKFLLND